MDEFRVSCKRQLDAVKCIKEGTKNSPALVRRAMATFANQQQQHNKKYCSSFTSPQARQSVEILKCINRNKAVAYSREEQAFANSLLQLRSKNMTDSALELKYICCSLYTFRRVSIDIWILIVVWSIDWLVNYKQPAAAQSNLQRQTGMRGSYGKNRWDVDQPVPKRNRFVVRWWGKVGDKGVPEFGTTERFEQALRDGPGSSVSIGSSNIPGPDPRRAGALALTTPFANNNNNIAIAIARTNRQHQQKQQQQHCDVNNNNNNISPLLRHRQASG